MTCILHLSDPHFGTEDPGLIEPLLQAVVAARPDVVVPDAVKKAAAEALVMGDPKDPTTQFSAALASQEHFTKVQGYLGTDALGGGRVLTGGVGEGWSVKPTIITDAPSRCTI